MPDEPLTDKIAALWRERFGTAEGLTLSTCAAGGNNRVYRGEASGQVAAVKLYFSQSRERRDRLDAEWRFLSYAAKKDIGLVPRPLARDEQAGIALHEFFPGSRPRSVDGQAIDAAIALFRALNEDPSDADLPDAAEACFTMAAHVALVDGRLTRLRAVTDAGALGLLEQMEMFWRDYRRGLTDEGAIRACVSPSDFGFHNALARPDGTLRFIDFEYAGWDDPVKMVCDFFLQPALPVDPLHYNRFFDATLGDRPEAEELAKRASLMRPLFALKWCCIMLNPFLPDLAARARFADPEQADDFITRRLAAATNAFRRLKD